MSVGILLVCYKLIVWFIIGLIFDSHVWYFFCWSNCTIFWPLSGIFCLHLLMSDVFPVIPSPVRLRCADRQVSTFHGMWQRDQPVSLDTQRTAPNELAFGDEGRRRIASEKRLLRPELHLEPMHEEGLAEAACDERPDEDLAEPVVHRRRRAHVLLRRQQGRQRDARRSFLSAGKRRQRETVWRWRPAEVHLRNKARRWLLI